MHHYTAYGLGIRSALVLPELQPSPSDNPDVNIRRGKVGFSLSSDGREQERYLVGADQAYLAWAGVGAYLVRHGNEIVVEPCSEDDESIVRLPLLGTIMALLLQQRGHLVLHASAVAVGGQAVVFVAGKGNGKSTMAATLCARGHSLLADDVVALDVSGERPIVLSGFPQVKLWPDAVRSVGGDPALLPRVAPGYEKRSRRMAESFESHPIPLAGIYLLSVATESKLTLLPPRDAILRLISNSYAARFGAMLLRGKAASQHLRQCTALVRTVPVFDLARPRSLALLSEGARLVEEQMQCTKPRRCQPDPLTAWSA